MSENEVAAKAAADESASNRYQLTIGDDFSAEIPRKFKRFKFMRAMSRGDMWAALEAVWPNETDDKGNEVNPVLDQLAELDVDEDELLTVVEALGNSLAGTSGKNLPTSPRS